MCLRRGRLIVPSKGIALCAHCDATTDVVAILICDRERSLLGGNYVCIHLSLRIIFKRSFFHLLAALLLVLMASALSAQIVETGIITGVVKDNTGAVVVKAT